MTTSTQSPHVPPIGTDSSMHESILCVSTCPRCNLPQPQRRFIRVALERLLKRGHPIEGYCLVCDEFWSGSPQESAAIAKALAG